MRSTILFLLLSFFCLTSFHPNKSEGRDRLEWLLGTWKGSGYQYNTKHVWSMELIFPNLNSKPIIKYESLGCSGIWELKEAKDAKAIFTENIQLGTDKCVQGSEVIVTRVNERHISTSFFLKSYSEDVMAFSVLVKQ